MISLRRTTMVLAGGACLLLFLSGCGSAITSSNNAPASIAVGTTRGVVMGGQQPVAGVTLQLYQAGTGGYGSAATQLGPSVQTTAAGNFNLPAYTCSSGSQVYLVGTGGQPIAASSTSPAVTNNNLALMVGLGTCGGSYLNNFINVNELTTVATIWALAPFMTGIANIGTSSANTAGLADAFATINQIVATANGTLPGPTLPTGATLPTTELNTLADILEQCINSAGGVAGDQSNCGNLFNLAPNAAGTIYPTDTITAAMNIAQNPGRNVASLNKLRSASPVFQPSLSVNSPPTAWTVAITYTGGGLNSPSSLAVDASGAVWVTNKTGSSVTKLDSTGSAISGATGFTAGGISSPSAIAIDSSGNAWIADAGSNSITELNSNGSNGLSFSGNGLSSPASIAIDGSGNVWVANGGSNVISVFTAGGGVLSGSPYSGAGITAPVSIAITPK
jgi:hypothetical protein